MGEGISFIWQMMMILMMIQQLEYKGLNNQEIKLKFQKEDLLFLKCQDPKLTLIMT